MEWLRRWWGRWWDCSWGIHVIARPWDGDDPLPRREVPRANGWREVQHYCPRCETWWPIRLLGPAVAREGTPTAHGCTVSA